MEGGKSEIIIIMIIIKTVFFVASLDVIILITANGNFIFLPFLHHKSLSLSLVLLFWMLFVSIIKLVNRVNEKYDFNPVTFERDFMHFRVNHFLLLFSPSGFSHKLSFQLIFVGQCVKCFVWIYWKNVNRLTLSSFGCFQTLVFIF